MSIYCFHSYSDNKLLYRNDFVGEIICEDLSQEVCAFSVSSSGRRCLLENLETKEGVEYQCTTSDVIVERMAEYIETDACVNACGLDRITVGISSDSLLEPQLTAKLCSPYCYYDCPNIIDLHFNLAAGEGTIIYTYHSCICTPPAYFVKGR